MSVTDAFRHPDNQFVHALRELLDAPTREAATAVLERHKTVLLTDGAIQLLDEFERDLRLSDPREYMYDPSYILFHRLLLINVRIDGISRGWEETEKMIAPIHTSREELKHAVRDLFKSMEHR